MIEEVPSFRKDELGTYYYEEETNEVEVLFKEPPSLTLEASVLIEMLADAIIDISRIQCLGEKVSQPKEVDS